MLPTVYLKALAACDALLAVDPKNPQSEQCRSMAYRYMGNPELALEADNRALKLLPAFAPAELDKAYDLIALNRDEEALSILNVLIKKNYRRDLAHYYRAKILQKQDQLALAHKNLEQALPFAWGGLAVDILSNLNGLSARVSDVGRLDRDLHPQFRSGSMQ